MPYLVRYGIEEKHDIIKFLTLCWTADILFSTAQRWWRRRPFSVERWSFDSQVIHNMTLHGHCHCHGSHHWVISCPWLFWSDSDALLYLYERGLMELPLPWWWWWCKMIHRQEERGDRKQQGQVRGLIIAVVNFLATFMPSYVSSRIEILIQTHSNLTGNILMWLNTLSSDLNRFLGEQIFVCHIVSWDGRGFQLLVLLLLVLLDWKFK